MVCYAFHCGCRPHDFAPQFSGRISPGSRVLCLHENDIDDGLDVLGDGRALGSSDPGRQTGAVVDLNSHGPSHCSGHPRLAADCFFFLPGPPIDRSIVLLSDYSQRSTGFTCSPVKCSEMVWTIDYSVGSWNFPLWPKCWG